MSDIQSNDTKLTVITDKLNRDAAAVIPVSFEHGGVKFTSMEQVMETAKLISISKGTPPSLRKDAATCLDIVMQAIEWKMSPWGVSKMAFVVNDRLAYQSQLLHAVVERRAPLKSRLRCSYSGENGERQCIVSGIFQGEDQPHEYTTPKIKDIKIKLSPLWTSDPDQQLWYYGSRAWARKWCPDVLLGVWAPDELEEFPVGEHAKDVSPNLMERLPGRMSDNGFKPDVVQTSLADPPPRARKARRKAEASQAGNIVPPAETAPSEPATQAAGPSIPVPDTPSHADAESPAASPTSGTGATDPERIPESADEYLVYAEYWILQSKNAADAYYWWDRDIGLRDELQVPIKDRNALLRQIEQTFGVRY